MRDALLNLKENDYWLYGPSVFEFDYVTRLIQKFSDYADEFVARTADDISAPPEFAQPHLEASSDLRYYSFLEKGLLWSFALWRLQGMFEALILHHYLPSRPKQHLIGFWTKLRALKEAGYRLDAKDEKELMDWARLRNLLSHAPPEHFHPIAIDRLDVEEYVALLKKVCAQWDSQHAAIHGL
jgi:hypothetical protein